MLQILKRDQEGKDSAPDVLKEEVSKSKSESTPITSEAGLSGYLAAGLRYAIEKANAKKEWHQQMVYAQEKANLPAKQASQPNTSRAAKTKAVPGHSKLGRRTVGKEVPWGQNYFGENMPGLKYENLQLEWFPKMSKLKKRYEPIVEQVTKLLMQHGKLGVAQRVCLTP